MIRSMSVFCRWLVLVGILIGVAAPVRGLTEPEVDEPRMESGLEYVIGVSDVLAVSVWRESELQAVVPVRPDGRIAVPLLGEVQVAGRTPLDVQSELTKNYERFVAAPAVSLVVMEINSRKVFVLGEVGDPGVFDIIRPTRLLQALAMAGGFTEFAKKDEVVVIREGEGAGKRFEVSIKAVTAGRNPQDNLLLRPGDTIYVP